MTKALLQQLNENINTVKYHSVSICDMLSVESSRQMLHILTSVKRGFFPSPLGRNSMFSATVLSGSSNLLDGQQSTLIDNDLASCINSFALTASSSHWFPVIDVPAVMGTVSEGWQRVWEGPSSSRSEKEGKHALRQVNTPCQKIKVIWGVHKRKFASIDLGTEAQRHSETDISSNGLQGRNSMLIIKTSWEPLFKVAWFSCRWYKRKQTLPVM